MTINSVWVVHRNDPLAHEIDVFEDWELAEDYAQAIDGHIVEEPILRADDPYVVMQMADQRYQCDGCGRIGNSEDGIAGHATDCPDEDCHGIVYRIKEEA